MSDIIDQHAISKLFYLADKAVLPAEDWLTLQIGERFLTYGPGLPVQKAEVDGTEGVLIGWPISKNRDDKYNLESLGEVGGRWVFITEDYILPDPLATYSIVFSTEQRLVAASPAVIPPDLLTADHSLNAALNLPNDDHWYPFGLTPWTNLSRLLPDHILDLTTHTALRQRRNVAKTDDESALNFISDNLQRSMATLAASTSLVLLATAGNDSRLLLAAAKGAPRLELLTFLTPSSLTDARIAKKLSLIAGVHHRTEEVQRNPIDEKTWFDVVGRCVAGASLVSAGLKLSLDSNKRYLKGIGGEIGRSDYYYYSGDEYRKEIDPKELILRMGLPLHERIYEACESWLSTLRGYRDLAELMEVVYRENRVGAWAGPQLHGDSIQCDWTIPLNQQKTVDSLRFLSLDTKKERLSAQLIINRLWPELLSVPINPISLWQRPVILAKTVRSKLISVSRTKRLRRASIGQTLG